MFFRSLLVTGLLTSAAMTNAVPVSAQVLLCPEPPMSAVDEADAAAEAERLLHRLTIALDLHGHRGIDEKAIMDAHAGTPRAFLDKLGNVAERCAGAAVDGVEAFTAKLPDLRKAFLDTTDALGEKNVVADGESPALKVPRTASKVHDAEQVEQSIDLSVRELWHKLWFRPSAEGDEQSGRWAVIVASPEDADAGWDALGKHQRTWKDAYFQLHEPYYESNKHHAIVVGRRLPEVQARRLLDYVKELGMADDAFVWALPADADATEAPADTDEPEKMALDAAAAPAQAPLPSPEQVKAESEEVNAQLQKMEQELQLMEEEFDLPLPQD
jgi:hypothetical protein